MESACLSLSLGLQFLYTYSLSIKWLRLWYPTVAPNCMARVESGSELVLPTDFLHKHVKIYTHTLQLLSELYSSYMTFMELVN